MVEFERGGTHVYADLGYPNAQEMFRKAQLTREIDKIIKARRWSQQKAAEVMGIPQLKLSEMLRGRFLGISETQMLEGLTRLGCEIQSVLPASLTLLANSGSGHQRCQGANENRFSSFSRLDPRKPRPQTDQIHRCGNRDMLEARFGLPPIAAAA